MITDPILRAKQVKALKDWYNVGRKQSEEWAARRCRHPPLESLPYPEICRGMECEAKARSVHHCKNDGTCHANVAVSIMMALALRECRQRARRKCHAKAI